MALLFGNLFPEDGLPKGPVFFDAVSGRLSSFRQEDGVAPAVEAGKVVEGNLMGTLPEGVSTAFLPYPAWSDLPC